jgi:CheY-like chemotaxis protein
MPCPSNAQLLPASLQSTAPRVRRILCVDDDPVSMRILTAILARPGWAVECVCDGQHAIDRFEGDSGEFDVLVTDHYMPRIDGLGLVRRLKAAGFAGRVVIVSAMVTPEDGEA